MTAAIEELGQTRVWLLNKGQSVFDLATGKKDENDFENSLLDTLSATRALYQQAVTEAKHSKSIDEVAEIWKEACEGYQAMYRMWQGKNALLGAPQNKLVAYWGDLIKKLEAASTQQYEFHASHEQSKLKLTAVFEACEEGGYHAFVAEIAGVHTQGETIKEAANHLADAIGLFLLDELEDKLPGVDSTDRIEIKLSFSSSQSQTTRA